MDGAENFILTLLGVEIVLAFAIFCVWAHLTGRLNVHSEGLRIHEKELANAARFTVGVSDLRKADIRQLQSDLADWSKNLEGLKSMVIANETATGIMQAQMNRIPEETAVTHGGYGRPPDNPVQEILAAQHAQINSMRRQMEEATVSGRGPNATPEVPPAEGAMFETNIGGEAPMRIPDAPATPQA